MPNIPGRAAALLAAFVLVGGLALAACGSKNGTASSAASSIAANPTVAGDTSAATAKARQAVNRCAGQLGGTAAPGFSELAQPAVLHHLATHGGREEFISCVTPDPAKQQAAKTCIGKAMDVFVLHPGAIAGSSSGSVARRHGAEQAVFACIETAAS